MPIGLKSTVFVMSLLVAGAASAQPQTLPPPIPGGPQAIPEKTPTSPGTTSSGTNSGTGNLSDKLDKSDGVIKPPTDVDPGMAKNAPATPQTQTMPVIKPPEEKGGPVAK